MLRKDGPVYTLGFAAFICTVCGLFVAGAAVMLREEQAINKRIDMQKNVLLAAGVLSPEDDVTPRAVSEQFASRVKPKVVTLATGKIADVAPADFDQRLAASDPKTSVEAPKNPAKVARVPILGFVFIVETQSRGELVVLPVEGKGLWSTLYGFLALDADDINIVRGIAFYEHGETPGLGGEIENPKWQALWNGREAFDDHFNPVLTVVKGATGPPDRNPHEVDGLSGATMTGNGVTHLVRFWLGEHGYGPYLRTLMDRREG